MGTQFKDSEEYQKWKAERFQHAPNATQNGAGKEHHGLQRLSGDFQMGGRSTGSLNLTTCEDCGRKVSKRAANCPHCGATVRGKTYSSNKKIIIIAVLSFGLIVLLAYLLVGSEPFWRTFDRGIVHEYNRRLSEANAIIQEHDALSNKSQESYVNKDPISSASFAKEYSEKVRQWGSP